MRKRACELATKYTYRDAASLLSAEIGEEISHYPVHHWVQRRGKVLREEEKWQATFEYGKTFEGKLALSKAKNMLIIGDGDQWIHAIAQCPYFMATYQIDWQHILVKIHQTFSEQPHLVSGLVGYLYSGKGKETLDTIKLARLLCGDSEKKKKIADLASYIENNFDGLYGSRSLESRVESKRVLVSSSGTVGRNIDVVISRRFKRQGMSWTKEGANNLLKLRILCYKNNDWEEFWER